MVETDKMKSIWNVDTQVSLFHAMQDYKPVGINRHFRMLQIYNKLNSSSSSKVSIECIWQYLNSLYNISALNESEKCQKIEKKIDFELPQEEFKDLIPKAFPRSRQSAIKSSSSSSSLHNLKSTPCSKTPSVIKTSSKVISQISSSSSSSSLSELKDADKNEETIKELLQETTKSGRTEPRKRTRQSTHNDESTPTSNNKRNRRN